MLTVKIEDQLKSREDQQTVYHYLELSRKGLLQLAKRLARIESGIRDLVC